MVTEEIGFIVVERTTHKKGHMPREVLHLSKADDTTVKTLCGWEFSNRTMIPLTSWGNADREWCGRCQIQKAALEASGRAEIDSTEKQTEE